MKHHPYPKIDENQPDIVEALEKCEYPRCTVLSLAPLGKGCADLLVGADYGWRKDNILMEVKMPGKALNDDQVKWHENWAGRIYTVWTAKQALNIVGATP